jgi:hypothetical protein
LVAFTITMTRIGPPLWLGAALVACSTHTSFGGTGNRHHLPRKNSLAIAAAGVGTYGASYMIIFLKPSPATHADRAGAWLSPARVGHQELTRPPPSIPSGRPANSDI